MNKQKKSNLFLRNFFPKNRKGDISIMIFVIGIIAICALTIFSFYLADMNFGYGFETLHVVQKLVSIEKEINFYESIGKTPEDEINIFKKEFTSNPFDVPEIAKGEATQIFSAKKDLGYLLEGSLVGGNKTILYVRYPLN